MTRQFTQIERQFSALNKEVVNTRNSIARHQQELQREGEKIQLKLRSIQATITRLGVDYQKEVQRARMTGRPTVKMERLGVQKNQKIQEYTQLRNGTERYYAIKHRLGQEIMKLRALEAQHSQMQRQFS